MEVENILDEVETIPKPISLQEVFGRVDGLLALDGLEKTQGMAALDEAILAGRATLHQAVSFVVLKSKIVGAESVLQTIGEDDPRYNAIKERCMQHRNQLRESAIRMGGAVKLTYGL